MTNIIDNNSQLLWFRQDGTEINFIPVPSKFIPVTSVSNHGNRWLRVGSLGWEINSDDGSR